MNSKCHKVITIFILLMFILSLSACVKDDYTYDLIGNYQIIHANSQSATLCKLGDVEGYSEIIIDRFILAYCYNEFYIGIERANMDNIPINSNLSINEIKQLDREFYIVDTTNDKLYGPLSSNEYSNQLDALDIKNMNKWTYVE